MQVVDSLAARPADVGTARSDDVRAGVVAMLPFIAGYTPFALVIGSAVADAASPVAGWSGSWLIYGGSAHVTALRTLGSSGAIAAIVTALVVNARLLVYSASLSRNWRAQPLWFRITGAALIVEPTWLLAERHDARSARAQRDFFLAAGLTLGVGWSVMIAIGAIAGDRLGIESLEVAVPLCLIALLAQRRNGLGDRAAMLVAVAVALLTSNGSSGFLVSIAAGCVAGTVVDGSRA
jgi:predicted branched-subunit amino acid permease